jgi:hypothetical protein
MGVMMERVYLLTVEVSGRMQLSLKENLAGAGQGRLATGDLEESWSLEKVLSFYRECCESLGPWSRPTFVDQL